MKIDKNLLSVFYIFGMVLTVIAVGTTRSVSVVTIIALLLCLVTLCALNDIGGVVSLRLGQLFSGLLMVTSIVGLMKSVNYVLHGYAINIIEPLIAVLFILVGWLTLKHLTATANIAEEDLVH